MGKKFTQKFLEFELRVTEDMGALATQVAELQVSVELLVKQNANLQKLLPRLPQGGSASAASASASA